MFAIVGNVGTAGAEAIVDYLGARKVSFLIVVVVVVVVVVVFLLIWLAILFLFLALFIC